MRTLAFVMQYVCRYIPVLISGISYTARQVDVFSIHEEVFVQQSYPIQCRTPHHTECSAHHVNASCLAPRHSAHIVTAETATWEHGAQSAHLVESCHWRGTSATRLRRKRSVGTLHCHTCTARIGMSIHKVEHTTYSVFRHNGIRIEQQHIFAAALTYCGVVGTCKTEVMAAAHNLYLRKTRAYELYGAVVRIVVDNKHLCVYVTQRKQ